MDLKLFLIREEIRKIGKPCSISGRTGAFAPRISDEEQG